MVKCSSCGTNNAATAKFCKECGTKQPPSSKSSKGTRAAPAHTSSPLSASGTVPQSFQQRNEALAVALDAEVAKCEQDHLARVAKSQTTAVRSKESDLWRKMASGVRTAKFLVSKQIVEANRVKDKEKVQQKIFGVGPSTGINLLSVMERPEVCALLFLRSFSCVLLFLISQSDVLS